MRLPPNRAARFVARPNRFVVEADVGGARTACFCANPGRLGELLVAGAALRVAPVAREGARTAHDALLVRHGQVWVGLDTRLGSPLFAEAVRAGRVPGLDGDIVAEVPLGRSRLDFRIGDAHVEVKSASLVVDGVARFPDAPSERATRHALLLAKLARRGRRAAMVFVVPRPDAEAFRPLEAADPAFARALRRAASAGVHVRAFRCASSPSEVRISDEIPVET